MIEMTTPTCASPGCLYDDRDGAMSDAGRRELHALLTDYAPALAGCSCAKCLRRAAPLFDHEARAVVEAVTDREAVLFYLGCLEYGGIGSVDDGPWTVRWVGTPKAPDDVLTSGACPFHTPPVLGKLYRFPLGGRG